MKLSDHLNEQQKKKLKEIKDENKLSERDLRELMGSNNRGFKRGKGGALRRA